MKKALSLVLAIVMVLSCVSSLAFAVATTENATWLAVENNTQKATYFDTLNTSAATWAADVAGGVTFYLLKDATHAGTTEFPTSWVATNPVIIDLNGHTLTSTQSAADFKVGGNGVLTVQNGIFNHTNAGQMFYMNATGAGVKDGTDTAVATLNVKNAFLNYGKTGGAFSDLVVYSLYNKLNLNVENSIIWSNNNAFGCTMRFEQLVLVTMDIKGSIIGNGAETWGIFSQSKPANTASTFVMNAVITAKDSALLSSDGSFQRAYWRYNVNGFQWGNTDGTGYTEANGTALTDWTFTAPGNVSLSSKKGWSFGTAPTSFTVAKTYGFVLDATGKLTNKIEATDGKFTAPAGAWNTKMDGSGIAYAAGASVPASAVLVPDYVTTPVADPEDDFGKVMAVTDAGKVCYFATLNTEAVTWAASQEGGATLYLLKDTEITDQIVFPATWSAKNPVILDLNGCTLTSNMNKSVIVLNGNGIFTLQNGYYLQNGTGTNFSIGVGAAGKYNSVGLPNEATLNLKNAVVLNTNAADNYLTTVVYAYYKKVNLNIDNSIVLAAHPTWSGTIYTEYAEKFVLKCNNSVIGSNSEQVFALRDKDVSSWRPAQIDFTVSNSVFAGTTGKLFRDQIALTINGSPVALADSQKIPVPGATLHDSDNWSITAPNGDVMTVGKAQIFGTAPTAISIDAYVILMNTDGKIESFNSISPAGFELPATGAKDENGEDLHWNTSADGTGIVYKAGDTITTGMVLFPANAKFVFTLDADYHLCTIQCATCGGCLNADCENTICAKKCVLATLKFDDVKEGHWYKNAVENVYHAGIMDGVSTTSFGAAQTTSRAMVVTTLWRMAGKPTTQNTIRFSDVKEGQWYSEAVRWAAGYGITTGNEDGTFAPDADVTREQLAAFLYRYAKYMGLNTSISADISAYSDASAVSEYAATAVKWANATGIMNGKDNGKLVPTGDASRAELAKMLMVISNL